ncbi:hypothetical protein KKC65_00450 [Patescibacteria group bacterium]|nr:hypothetical protein [Patescibacteria group bacterium]
MANNFECRRCNGSMHHDCWKANGKDLCPNCLRRITIIEILSEVHVRSSNDPEVLCAGTFHDFNYDQKNLSELRKIQALQNELFMACRKTKEGWAL